MEPLTILIIAALLAFLIGFGTAEALADRRHERRHLAKLNGELKRQLAARAERRQKSRDPIVAMPSSARADRTPASNPTEDRPTWPWRVS